MRYSWPVVASATGEERWSSRSSGRSRCAGRGAGGAGPGEAAGPARDPAGPRERARLQRSADRGAVAGAAADRPPTPSRSTSGSCARRSSPSERGGRPASSLSPGLPATCFASSPTSSTPTGSSACSVRQGRPRGQATREAAASTLRAALDLWRGPALADFAYDPFAQAEIARLEELRLDAVEERIEADLALGRSGELVGELEALTRDNPLRERLRGQLMLALYRSGRQADALEVYRQTRESSTRSSASLRARRFSACRRRSCARSRRSRSRSRAGGGAAGAGAGGGRPGAPRCARRSPSWSRAGRRPGPRPGGASARGRALSRRRRADRRALWRHVASSARGRR